MDVREKLVELIEKASYECDEGTRDLYDMREVADGIADFLIAHGVTVQEWISVEDRLTEQGEEAICIAADGDMMIGKYTEWGWMFPCYFEDPTRWMPLPLPPKGE